jgi:xylitol oxidase
MEQAPARPDAPDKSRRDDAPLTNWAGNVVYGAASVSRPTTLAQLRSVVARADRVRAVGTGHSFNRIADTRGELVSVAGLPRVVDIDTARRVVRVSAGTRYGDLVEPLHTAGLALHNLGSLPHISVGGACATGTHGSGVGNGTLASAVTALALITADGDEVRLSRTEDPDVFDGCVIALGALGIVTALELGVQPAFDVRQHVYEGLSLEALHQHFDEILSAAYSVSLFSDWRSRQVDQVWRKERIAGPLAAGGAEAPVEWFGAALADGPRHPVPGLPGGICTEQGGRPGPWYARLPHFRLGFTPSSGQELQSEWFVRREDGVAALEALEDLRERIAALLHIAEIRTIAADPLWLSPSAGRDTVALHFTWVSDEPAVRLLVAQVEQCLAPFGARSHWGKVHDLDPARLREQYERYADFARLTRRYDPKGKLRNDLLDRWFPRDEG